MYAHTAQFIHSCVSESRKVEFAGRAAGLGLAGDQRRARESGPQSGKRKRADMTSKTVVTLNQRRTPRRLRSSPPPVLLCPSLQSLSLCPYLCSQSLFFSFSSYIFALSIDAVVFWFFQLIILLGAVQVACEWPGKPFPPTVGIGSDNCIQYPCEGMDVYSAFAVRYCSIIKCRPIRTIYRIRYILGSIAFPSEAERVPAYYPKQFTNFVQVPVVTACLKLPDDT